MAAASVPHLPPASADPVVLLTRPQAASDRFAAMLPQGMRALIAPLMTIAPVAFDPALLDAARGLVFTSEHAVAMAGAGRGRPALCVGPRTAAAARARGFAVTEGPGDALRLEPLIRAAGPGLVHPHGRHVARVLPVPGVVVYDQIAQPLDAAARALLDDSAARVIVTLFSPRSARLLAQAVGQMRANPVVVSISAAADAQWPGPARQRVIAQSPDAAAMCRAVTAVWQAERTTSQAG
ncbi:uroporphyrinogen-III synthase [Paracoccus jiaweipingae]|uniref:uroporphyrinogen-III synthase n=1 Tax=unclassified Paracoccus (in: a-proteobacteria) TaxID=2688777 RepID=UPI003790AEFF